MKKVFLMMFVVATVLSFSICLTNAANDITVKVDGKVVTFPDQKPFVNSDNRTMVPVRFIVENIGAKVEWDKSSNLVTISTSSILIQHIPGRKNAYVNGVEVQFDTTSQIVNGRTMVPLRFISESLGATVRWDAPTRTVDISLPIGELSMEEKKTIADLVRKVIDLEIAGKYDESYKYFSEQSKAGIVAKLPDFFSKYYCNNVNNVSGAFKTFIREFDIKEYDIKCIVEKKSDSKIIVYYGLYGKGQPIAADIEAITVSKENGLWNLNFEFLACPPDKVFENQEGI